MSTASHNFAPTMNLREAENAIRRLLFGYQKTEKLPEGNKCKTYLFDAKSGKFVIRNTVAGVEPTYHTPEQRFTEDEFKNLLMTRFTAGDF